MTTLSKLPKANQELCADAANARRLDHEITFIGTIAQCGRAHNAINGDGQPFGFYPTLGRLRNYHPPHEAIRALPTRGAS